MKKEMILDVTTMVIALNEEVRELQGLPMTVQRFQAAEYLLIHTVATLTALAAVALTASVVPLEHGDFVQPLVFSDGDLEQRS